MSTYTRLLRLTSDIDRLSAKKKEVDPKSDVTVDDLPDQCVFRSLDRSGDFANTDFYLAKKRKTGMGDRLLVVDPDGGVDWFSLPDLNIDRKSIRKLRDSDPDFEGMRD